MIHRRMSLKLSANFHEDKVGLRKEEPERASSLFLDKEEAGLLVDNLFDMKFVETPVSIWAVLYKIRSCIKPDPVIAADVPSMHQVNIHLKEGLSFAEVLFFNVLLRKHLAPEVKITYILSGGDLKKTYIYPDGHSGHIELRMVEEQEVK